MQVDNNSKITLRQLQSLEFQQQEEERQIQDNPFALYISANQHQWCKTGQELLSKDTFAFPIRPIRRVACKQCLTQNINCQMCDKCHYAGKTCCRSINCIYELQKYLSRRQAQLYKKCECCQEFQPSTNNFSIDWRLFYLIHKLGQIKIVKYTYLLHCKLDILFVTEQEEDRSDDRRTINRMVFEQSYSAQQTLLSKNSIRQQNIIGLQRLFQTGILKHVKQYYKWQENNIEGSCREIMSKFKSNQQLQQITAKLKTKTLQQQHQYQSGCSLYEPKKYINVTETTAIINHNRFKDLSSAINRDILFCYHNQTNSLIVKNAKYDQKQDSGNSIKIYGIMSDIKYDLSGGVWFKDRKGDIFAIHQQFISIFKFHMLEKKYKQIVLRQDKLYENVVSSDSIAYVAMIDTVYFFDCKHFGRTYYFQLYRPYLQQKQFSNCLAVNPITSLPNRLSLFGELLFIKAVSVIQEVDVSSNQTAKKDKKNTERVQLIPVIYLLAARKQAKQVFRLYRLVHHQSIYEIKQVKPAQEGDQNEIEFDYRSDIFTVFKKEKQICVCLQTEISRNPRLLQGRVAGKKSLQVVWQIHNKALHENNTAHKTFKIMKEPLSSGQLGEDYDILVLNDTVGVRSNSSSRYLGYSASRNTFIEVILHINQGQYTWEVGE